MFKKIALILGLISVALTTSRCSDDDDDFRYTPIDTYNTTFELTFDVRGETVDGAFMAQTSGFCHENRDSLEIMMGGRNYLIVNFPSPNAYGKSTTTKTEDATVTTMSYMSSMTIGGKRTEVRTYFTMTVPYMQESNPKDPVYRLTEVEIGGSKARVTPSSESAGYVCLVKGEDGGWVAED
ncbi:MAG: hypothetical protein ACI35Q_02975 [Marinilabiliaceae bacterium]